MARTKRGFYPVKTLHGGPPAITHLPLVAATYYEGAVLRLSSTTGSAKKFVADATAIIGVLGCYVTTADSSTGKYPVYLADTENVFEALRAATGSRQTRVGDFAEIAVGTTDNYYLESTGTSPKHVKIIDFDPDTGAAGKFNTSVTKHWVVFNQETSIMGESSATSDIT